MFDSLASEMKRVDSFKKSYKENKKYYEGHVCVQSPISSGSGVDYARGTIIIFNSNGRTVHNDLIKKLVDNIDCLCGDIDGLRDYAKKVLKPERKRDIKHPLEVIREDIEIPKSQEAKVDKIIEELEKLKEENKKLKEENKDLLKLAKSAEKKPSDDDASKKTEAKAGKKAS